MEAITLNDDIQPGMLIGRLRERKHPAVRDDLEVPDNADEKAPYCAGYNKAINDAIDLFGEWMVDLLKEYPKLEQDIQQHDRERLEEYLDQLNELEAEAENEETLQEIEEVRSKIRSVRGKLDILEEVSSHSAEADED